MANTRDLAFGVDLRSRQNNLAHRTREIDWQRLIVRRGQPFSITLQDSDSLPPKHDVELVLHVGKKDEVVIKLQKERGAGDKWWFSQQKAQDDTLLTLHSPADAIVGSYRLVVLLVSPNGQVLKRTADMEFHVLFNPWCKDDAVYLPDEHLLQEYIMNEHGVIFMGASDYIQSCPWNYGQFEDDVMKICFQILDNSNNARSNSKMDLENRSDPVYVGRIITAMVNSNDDRGVLTGRWHEPYAPGVAPNKWTGSVQILRKWSEAGLRAVNYGQCWVFAGVACTVLRCLGIPTRLITNFSSAHDVDGNLAVDFLVDENFKSLEGARSDSKWNFHCWVESWMKRDDLPKGNDGWQVLDPTPQELSDGVFCCGPCPVKAIKEGNLGVKYDAPFIFAEVNADIVHWMVKKDGQRKKIRVNQTEVGTCISTKSVYGDQREDVTLQYKYPEGSKEEREVYNKAGRRTTDETPHPGQLKLSIKNTKAVSGTDFDIIVEVENQGDQQAKAQLTIIATAVTYTSHHRGDCNRKTVSVTVPAHKTHQEVLRLRYEHYAKNISEHQIIRATAVLEAPDEKEPIMVVKTIPLESPELLVQVPGNALLKQKITAYISFVNPLPVPLKNGVFTLEGAGLLPATEIPVNQDIAPGQKMSVKFSFIPLRHGVKKLLVDFDSDRLKGIKGVATLVIRKIYSPEFF